MAGTHSEFGRIVFSCKLDGNEPYLDVRQPIPLLHLIEAAETAGVPDGEVLPTIDAVFELLGWDFSRGSRPRRRTRVA